jgi:hypothetical protein
MSSYIDKEKTTKALALILEKIRTEADPLVLDEYRRLFKKEVSLFQRSNAAAYLLMLCDQGKSLRSLKADKTEKHSPGKAANGKRSAPAAGDAQHYPLADEDSKRLFFSVGRSRRVFPREILGLINTKTAVPKEDIGAIRILDNYSFVQVRDTVAEKIIDALNGTGFRGRPLVVNYAKSRKDEENGAAENDDEAYGDTADDGSEQYQDHSEKEYIEPYSHT